MVKSAAHVRAGHEARAAGVQWEDAVDGWLRELQQLRVVAWWESGQPKKFGRVFASASGADRSGILRWGRGFAMEAKTTAPGAHFERRRVSERQADHLAVASWHALSLLALQFRSAPPHPHRLYLLPWGDAPWERPPRGRQLILRADDLAGWQVSADSFVETFSAYAAGRDRP